jgi:hypothetical protein
VQPNLHDVPALNPQQAWIRGTVTALVVALPAGILNQLLVSNGDVTGGSPWAVLFWILIVLGAAAGGWAVIRLSPRAHLGWAAGAGAGAYVVVQAIGVVRRLIAGDTISWLAYPFLLLLMAVCGMLGGMFAARTVRRYGADEGSDDGGPDDEPDDGPAAGNGRPRGTR